MKDERKLHVFRTFGPKMTITTSTSDTRNILALSSMTTTAFFIWLAVISHLISSSGPCQAWPMGVGVLSTFGRPSSRWTRSTLKAAEGGSSSAHDQIISPFDDSASSSSASSSTATYTLTDPVESADGPLDLTWENVEMVLEEMRPYLIQDGGNVAIQEIDGPVVKLELQGACGTCPSSTQTMKMGLERRLRERIPEIQEVIQALPEGPPLNEEQINVVLNGVRPFLQVAGGTIDTDRIEGVGGLQPTIWLHMKGSSASLNSVKLEIAQRLQRHFMMPGLRVEWVQ